MLSFLVGFFLPLSFWLVELSDPFITLPRDLVLGLDLESDSTCEPSAEDSSSEASLASLLARPGIKESWEGLFSGGVPFGGKAIFDCFKIGFDDEFWGAGMPDFFFTSALVTVDPMVSCFIARGWLSTVPTFSWSAVSGARSSLGSRLLSIAVSFTARPSVGRQ